MDATIKMFHNYASRQTRGHWQIVECRDQAREIMKQGKPVNRTTAVVIITIWLFMALLLILFVTRAIEK